MKAKTSSVLAAVLFSISALTGASASELKAVTTCVGKDGKTPVKAVIIKTGEIATRPKIGYFSVVLKIDDEVAYSSKKILYSAEEDLYYSADDFFMIEDPTEEKSALSFDVSEGPKDMKFPIYHSLEMTCTTTFEPVP